MNSPVRVWRNHKKIKDLLNLKGVVLTWTKIYSAPAGFEKEAPYFSAIIKLSNPPVGGNEKLTAMVVDCDELKTGDRVKTVLRRIGEVGKDEVIEYGIKCVKI